MSLTLAQAQALFDAMNAFTCNPSSATAPCIPFMYPFDGCWARAHQMCRLMLAQDSGGAIQGAVRADYFYGFGQTAQTQASRTKERLRMWVLLPKGLPIAAQDSSFKTRGGPAVSNSDCLVSDPELCVDDAP